MSIIPLHRFEQMVAIEISALHNCRSFDNYIGLWCPDLCNVW